MDYRKIVEEHEKTVNSYIRKMEKYNYQETLSDIYNYVKSITDIYYNGYRIHNFYQFLRDDIIYAENMLPCGKLLDVPICFDASNEPDGFIEYIAYSARKYLIDEHMYFGHLSIEEMDFSDYCKKAAVYIKELCDKYHVESYILQIYPGYEKSAFLYCGNGYHFANIVKFNNKYYLVDVTYSQFFYEKRNNLDRLGLVNISGCDPGIFMLMTDKGKKIATTILQEGYIELDDEIFKTYLDAFTISFRNGLYYEVTNDLSYTTSYSIDDYISFLSGNDNQIKHEKEECLGYQKRPLKNWDFKFRK